MVHPESPARPERPEGVLHLPLGTDIPFDASLSLDDAIRRVEQWMQGEECRTSQVVSEGRAFGGEEGARIFMGSPRLIGERLITILRVLQTLQIAESEEMLIDGCPVRLEPGRKITFLQQSEAARLRERAVGAPVAEDGTVLPLIEETRQGPVRAWYVETRPDRLAA